MSTDEVMRVLLRECPNGVSFAPMALRLLRQKVPLKDSQIEGLRSQMFQLENSLWFSSEMISDKETLSLLRGRASEWLGEHGCFSAERLSEGFSGNLRHVATPEQFAAFLQHLGFPVAGWRGSGFFCHQPPLSLEERLAEGSRTIAGLLEEAGGTLAFSKIHEAMPHLTVDALEGVREQFLQDVHRTEVGGHPCWRSAEAIPLPEDFAEKLTAAVDSLVALGEKVSAAKVEFALNLSYGMRFREVYGLPDHGAFMRLCAKHYQGANDVFPRATKASGTPGEVSSPAKRTRSANTRFLNLGIPIGAELVFTRDSRKSCTVLDDSNQVRYEGKMWALSVLARHLLKLSAAHGYRYFSYRGESLWERRLRLERESNGDGNQTDKMTPPTKVMAPETGIIGLSGRPLSPATWRAFKGAGTDPRVAEWSRRVENGESVEAIARESGYAASTVKLQIGDRRRYFKVCDINQIMPEGGPDV